MSDTTTNTNPSIINPNPLLDIKSQLGESAGFFSIPVLIFIFIGLLLSVLALVGSHKSTFSASNYGFMDKGSMRAYSLTVAACIFAFITSLSSNGLAAMALAVNPIIFVLYIIKIIMLFVAGILLAVAATPYGMKTSTRRSIVIAGTVCFGLALAMSSASTVMFFSA
jgi:hypothetical protein